jgi:hypothetical protein
MWTECIVVIRGTAACCLNVGELLSSIVEPILMHSLWLCHWLWGHVLISGWLIEGVSHITYVWHLTDVWSRIRNVQDWYDIRWHRAHGEDDLVDLEAVEKDMELGWLIRSYWYTDVYYMDETVLFFFNNVPNGSPCVLPWTKQRSHHVSAVSPTPHRRTNCNYCSSASRWNSVD